MLPFDNHVLLSHPADVRQQGNQCLDVLFFNISKVSSLTRRHLRSQAIIVRTSSVGDIHRLVTALSPSLGVVRAMAYGAAKTTSRMRLATLLFIHADLRLYRDPVKDQYRITEISCREEFGGIRNSLGRYYAASLWAEVVLRSPGAAESDDLFALLLDCLSVLQSADQVIQRGLLVQFIWRYLRLAGLQPELHRCASCNDPLPQSAKGYLSEVYGDMRCGICSEEGDRVLSAGARAYLLYSTGLNPARAAGVRLQDDASLRQALYRMVQRSIDMPLATLQVGADFL